MDKFIRIFEFTEQLFDDEKTARQACMIIAGIMSACSQRLSERWHKLRVFDWYRDVPWTNNGTEQAIGRMKIRSRTVRGYKSWQGM